MLHIYYAHTDTLSYDLLMTDAMVYWPDFICNSIVRYKHRQDQLRTAAGKLLLMKALQELNLADHLPLTRLLFTAYQKPVFDYPIDFSISHSGTYALLAITTEGKTGIDIEMVQPVNREEFRDIFTPREWNALRQSSSSEKLFYQLWTKKEAVVKAIGKGLYTPLSEIDALNDTMIAEQETYQLGNLMIDPEYAAHCAISVHPEKWPLPQQVILNDCIRDLFTRPFRL